MAGLLEEQTGEPHTLRNLLIIAAILIGAAALAFGVFFRHENHADVEATGIRVMALPLHVAYAHQANTAGADQTEDATYIVAVVQVRDRSYAPLFVKDVDSEVRLQDGRLDAGRRIGAADRERLRSLVPQLQPLLAGTGVGPLDAEQKIEANTTVTGYVVFLYPFASTEWDKCKEAAVTLDFYHQDSVRVPLPQ